jgi:protein-S-isoprenylcysteine O-methyltransferase Ste14
MKRAEEDSSARGTGWVVAQFALAVAGLSAGPLWHSQWTGTASFAGGAMFVALSALTGLLGKRDLGTNRTPFPRPKDDARLVTSGIYARVRHPLYLSVICLGFGWALLWRSWPALALAAMQIPFFDAKARHEERWLSAQFPDFAAYARRVKRFIPGVY